MSVGNKRLRKAWLEKSLKRPVREHPSTVKMLKVPEHWLNLQHSTFTINLSDIELVNVFVSGI